MSGTSSPTPRPTRRRAPIALIVLAATLAAAPAAAQLLVTEDKLTASDADAADLFGFSVSVDGDTALVGGHGNDDAGSFSGSAYVFTSDASGVWTEQAKLTASDADAGDFFGASVSVDGDTALVGASGDDDAGSQSGSAYVFTRDGSGAWTEQAKLTASDAADLDRFGGAVSLDGDTALVGATGDDDAGSASGSAYVFIRSAPGVWTEQAKLTASDGAAFDAFGGSVSLDGDTALVGATGDDDAGSASGSAYAFIRDGSGVWTEQAKLTASDAETGDSFGASVALDGDTALVGAHRDDDGSLDSGSAYVFTRDGAGVWTEQAKLTASDAAGFDRFGVSVALDGDTALVGAWLDDDAGSQSGSAYTFTRAAPGVWTEQSKLTASDAAAFDRFGVSVALDGDTALVGAYLDDDAGSSSGSAYVFQCGELGLGLWTLGQC